jgi:hypothetical protein
MKNLNIYQILCRTPFNHEKCIDGMSAFVETIKKLKNVSMLKKVLIIERYDAFLILWNKYIQIYTDIFKFLVYRRDTSLIPYLDDYLREVDDEELYYLFIYFFSSAGATCVTRKYGYMYSDMTTLFRYFHTFEPSNQIRKI